MVLEHRSVAFARDPAVQEPVSALVGAVHLSTGFNRLRLATRVEVPETATDAEELVLARVRHRRGLGGRADLVVTGGDVPETSAWVVSECWTAGLTATYRIVRECPGDGIGGERCTIVASTGPAPSCPAGLEAAELPPADPMAEQPDPEDPNEEIAIPTDVPDGAAPED